jgi:hypothetical protein
MDKKEIESPKLTGNFLIWISAFMLLVFALLAHLCGRSSNSQRKKGGEAKERPAAAKAGLPAATNGTTESRALPETHPDQCFP